MFLYYWFSLEAPTQAVLVYLCVCLFIAPRLNYFKHLVSETLLWDTWCRAGKEIGSDSGGEGVGARVGPGCSNSGVSPIIYSCQKLGLHSGST